jgi:hypothetical protein
MTLTPPVITPEQIEAVRAELAAKYVDLAYRGTFVGDDAQDHDLVSAILALNNSAWTEKLAGQEAAIYVGANSLRQVANGNSMTIDASPEACKWADTPLYTTQVPAQAQASPKSGEWFCGNCGVPAPTPIKQAPAVAVPDGYVPAERERIFALWMYPDSSDWDGVLGSYCTFDEAVEAWKQREDQRECSITARNRGVIAKADLLVWKFGAAKASSTCPICQSSEPHEHSGKEIHDFREEEEWSNSTRTKLWEDIMVKVKSIEAPLTTAQAGEGGGGV